MSRTDKDRPGWLRSTWWEPDHRGCRHAVFDRGRTCDLPDRPILERPARATWRTVPQGCTWVPCHDYYHGYQPGGAPTWYVRLEFTGPARRRTRDELTRARQEYRATGQIDIIPATTQHRHMARWSWW